MIRRTVTFAASAFFCASVIASTAFAADKGDAAKGKQVFEQCSMCHNVDSPEKKMGPSLQGLFKKKTLPSGKPATDENVMQQVNNGGNGMPGYGDSLSAQEKTDLLAYLHTL